MENKSFNEYYPLNLIEIIFGESFDFNNDEAKQLSIDKNFLSDYEKMLNSIDDECKDLVVKYFKDGKDLNEIALEEKVSYEEIKDRYAKMLKQLRHPSRSKILSNYLQDIL